MREITTGAPVRSLQTMLRQISELDTSIPAVVPDGIYGRDTLAAVSAFQRTRGLPVTGVADLTTWEAIVEAYFEAQAEILPPEPLYLLLDRQQVIEPNDQNLHIWVVQGVLAALAEIFENIPEIVHTGKNDEETQAAISFIQAASGLPVTGILDRTTWKTIARLYSSVRNGIIDTTEFTPSDPSTNIG